jgi:catechol 2,3-dioxygenase-like lactoylglutathione lyase family enzyme
MKFHSTVVFVKDIEKTKDFYLNLLNQEIEHDFGRNIILKSGITLWEMDANHLIKKKLETDVNSNRFELYFESENIDNVFEKLNKYGFKFLHKITTEDWGQRTLRFFDPDNHLIEVGEPLEVFVKNMFESGLNTEQISLKSGISEEAINKILKI